MANEITTTSFNDVTTATTIAPVLLRALSDRAQLLALARELPLYGRPGNSLSVPIFDAYWGSVGDRGAGVDTEFNATEAVEISNTPATTSMVSFSTAEYGIAHEITDNVEEDTIDGLDLLSILEETMTNALRRAMEDDLVALFAGLSTSVGVSGTDLTVAQFLAARTGLLNGGVSAPDGLIAVLDPQQAGDIEGAFMATGTSMAVYAMAADRMINFQPGSGVSGAQRMSLFNVPVITSDLTDTANTGADVVGAMFVPSSAANDAHATFGQVWKRLPRLESDRHAKKRTTDIVVTTRWGCGELRDASGTKIVTDAP